ncbi:hypothetical protein BC828DRAFT_371607 [Blastocladiella britannica]|nr:hypothetical protein BC828DRAFT_371607 [Blastocladiella britannica]
MCADLPCTVNSTRHTQGSDRIASPSSRIQKKDLTHTHMGAPAPPPPPPPPSSSLPTLSIGGLSLMRSSSLSSSSPSSSTTVPPAPVPVASFYGMQPATTAPSPYPNQQQLQQQIQMQQQQQQQRAAAALQLQQQRQQQMQHPMAMPPRRPVAGIESDLHNRARCLPNGLVMVGPRALDAPTTTATGADGAGGDRDGPDDDYASESDSDAVPLRSRRTAARAAAHAMSRSDRDRGSSSSLPTTATPAQQQQPPPPSLPVPPTYQDPSRPFDVTSQFDVRVPRSDKRVITRTNHLYHLAFSPAQRRAAAAYGEALVPVVLDLDIPMYAGSSGGHSMAAGTARLRDAFLWNARDPMVTAEKFAEILCTDLLLPPRLVPVIAAAIRLQVDEWAGDASGGGDAAITWLEGEAEAAESVVAAAAVEAADEEDSVLIPIEIDLVVGRIHLRDRFDWDPRTTLTPEQLAMQTVADLGLPRELAPIYAASVRGQLVAYVREHLLSVPGPRDAPSVPVLGKPAPPASSTLSVPLTARDPVAFGTAVCVGASADAYAAYAEDLDLATASAMAAAAAVGASGEANDRDARRARRFAKSDAAVRDARVRDAEDQGTKIAAYERALTRQFALAARAATPLTAAAVYALAPPTAGGVPASAVLVPGSGGPAAAAAGGGPTTANAAHNAMAATLSMSAPPPLAPPAGSAAAPASGPPLHNKRGLLLRTGQSTRGGLEPILADKLPPITENKSIKTWGQGDVERWHCTNCFLDSTRTMSIRKGPMGPRTLWYCVVLYSDAARTDLRTKNNSNACGIRFSSDAIVPIQRKNRFKHLYPDTKDLP